jgi:hypothetical protein
MEKLIVHILPNWIDIPIKILTITLVISFATFIFAAIKKKFKLFIIFHLTFIISMILSFLIIFIIAIAGVMPDKSNSYTIKKIDDTVTVTSHSKWIANSTYNIITHKDGIYYLENNERKDKVIKISDEDFEKLTN